LQQTNATRTALNDAQIDALLALERMNERSHANDSSDLVAIGFAAIGSLLSGFLSDN